MSLREVIERIGSNPVPDNEETAKFRILAPVLECLSWSPSGQEVLWEHPVGGKKGGGKVDIALRAEGRIWALVEVKAPGANLNQHVEQVLGYAFYEGVDICALSDGLQWWLYLPREPGSHEERRFSVLHLGEDPVDQICDDLNAFLGRESLMTGQAVRQAKQVRRALREAAQLEKEMPAIWQRMLDKPDDELVELIGQRVYDKLRLRPGREQIVAAMRKMPIPARKLETTEAQDQIPSEAPGSDRLAGRKPTQRPAAVRLWGERHPVRTHVEILTTVVAEVHRRHPHDFDRAVETLRAGEWQYVSREPQRVRGTRIRQTPSGHYVDVNLSARQVKRRAVELLEVLGHRESDLEYLYE